MGLKLVKSYTTRPMRPGEEKDSDHIFITEDEVDQYRNQIAAYTEIDGYKYFTTYDVIDQSDVYVIDPAGITSIKEKCGDRYKFVEIYIWVTKEIARRRAIERGDDMGKFKSRYEDEHLQFAEYEGNSNLRYFLRNIRPFEESVEIVCTWIQKELNKQTLYVDFDGVIVDSIKAICDLYNEDFSYYSDFNHVDPKYVQTYEFSECSCASKEIIDWYFNTPRFFDKLEFMPSAYDYLKLLSTDFRIVIVSHGFSPNLRAKEKWVNKHLPFAEFYGVNLKDFRDKSCVDMSGGIFIDDKISNLDSSNAGSKLVFGKRYPWNDDDSQYIRVWDWDDVYTMFALADMMERKWDKWLK